MPLKECIDYSSQEKGACHLGSHGEAGGSQSGGRKEGRESLGTAFIGVSTGKTTQGGVNSVGLAGLNSSGRC